MSIEAPVRLLEIIDRQGLTDLARRFVDAQEVGLRIFDADGEVVVDLPRDAGLSAWVFRFPLPRRRFTDFVTSLKTTHVDHDEVQIRQDPVTHSRFILAPIVHEFDVLGRVILGPYLPPDEPDELPEGHPYADSMDPQHLARLRADLPHCSDPHVRRQMAALRAGLDLAAHAGWRAVITSKVHLESITEAYNDLQAANTKLQAVNADLAAQNERLQEVDKIKSNFIGTVSHELRTPLTSVIGYGEMLLEGLAGTLNDEQRDYVQHIVARGSELLDLITGILDISRIEQGGQRLNRAPVNLDTLVRESLASVTPQARTGGLILAAHVPDDIGPCEADGPKLRQVLINLLGNAVKFTAKGGRVSIRADRDPTGAVLLAVSDTGIGLGPDELTRIFEPFYQADASSTRAHGGTGLGLSIVKSFVELHGGSVAVRSTPGVGTTFTVRLPPPSP